MNLGGPQIGQRGHGIPVVVEPLGKHRARRSRQRTTPGARSDRHESAYISVPSRRRRDPRRRAHRRERWRQAGWLDDQRSGRTTPGRLAHSPRRARVDPDITPRGSRRTASGTRCDREESRSPEATRARRALTTTDPRPRRRGTRSDHTERVYRSLTLLPIWDLLAVLDALAADLDDHEAHARARALAGRVASFGQRPRVEHR